MGMLSHMVVDWYAPRGILGSIIKHVPVRALDRAFAVQAEGIPDALITPLNLVGLKDRVRCNFWRRFGRSSQATLMGDIAFAKAVSRANVPPHDAFFGYSYASLEAMREEKKQGKFIVLDQIDPGEREHEIIHEEARRWHQYVAHPNAVIPRRVYDRLHEEWMLADLIIVNSEWSRICNIEKGAPAEKIFVLPLAYEPKMNIDNLTFGESSQNHSPKRDKKVRILWVGRVTLQKGIQYLVEAARLLKAEPVEFLIAGESNITESSIRHAPSNMRWLGKVSHAQKELLYRSATAFVLPTLSDGFAITQLEALAHGLPIIATSRCGRVLEEGKTGFVIPPHDPVALANAVMRFVSDSSLHDKMSSDCKTECCKYSIDAYGSKLVSIINNPRAQAEYKQPFSS